MKKYILITATVALIVLIYTVKRTGWIPSIAPAGYGLEPHTIKGIDVSHHQRRIDWKKVKQDSVRFVFIKSTQGRYFKDSLFKLNFQEAQQNGILIGAYHFFHAGHDPRLQFANFKRNTHGLELDFPPVIDLEYLHNPSLKRPENKTQFLNDLAVLEQLMEEHYGVEPIFYTTPSFYQKMLKGHFSNKLWICDTRNRQIDYLKVDQWALRQYSHAGHIKGIKGKVDLNFFNGSPEEFSRFMITRVAH